MLGALTLVALTLLGMTGIAKCSEGPRVAGLWPLLAAAFCLAPGIFTVLITAGLYNGATTGATEETYAGLNPDGSTGSVNGATGSNTISSAGGGNPFNHAAVGYLDATGAFHVLVVGGDDVNTPTTKHKGAYYY